MKQFLLLLAFVTMLVSGPLKSNAYVIDFSATGNMDDVFCASVANVSYCDENKYQYGWFAPYIMLSDYDFSGRFRLVADAGTYFTPVSMLLGAASNVWRAFCDAVCLQDPENYVFSNQDQFELVSIPFLDMVAYRDGVEVLRQTFDPALGVPAFDDRFNAISELEIYISRSYFESARVEADGYVYTCWPNMYYFCHTVDIDDFTFATSSIAAVPLPAGGALLLTVLAMLGVGRAVRRKVY